MGKQKTEFRSQNSLSWPPFGPKGRNFESSLDALFSAPAFSPEILSSELENRILLVTPDSRVHFLKLENRKQETEFRISSISHFGSRAEERARAPLRKF